MAAAVTAAARGSFPDPSSSRSQQRRRPRCPPTRNGSAACWRRTRSLRPAESKGGRTMRSEVWAGRREGMGRQQRTISMHGERARL
eukprot:scaffold2864_cov52-Phaeocystis_antarctica.AAC.4